MIWWCTDISNSCTVPDNIAKGAHKLFPSLVNAVTKNARGKSHQLYRTRVWSCTSDWPETKGRGKEPFLTEKLKPCWYSKELGKIVKMAKSSRSESMETKIFEVWHPGKKRLVLCRTKAPTAPWAKYRKHNRNVVKCIPKLVSSSHRQGQSEKCNPQDLALSKVFLSEFKSPVTKTQFMTSIHVTEATVHEEHWLGATNCKSLFTYKARIVEDKCQKRNIGDAHSIVSKLLET